MIRVTVRQQRPYIITFGDSGLSYPMTSYDAQHMISGYRVVKATSARVLLRGDSGMDIILRPATRGGGPAFEVSRTARW